jgi:glutamate-ammonia-ligase adenylyltransferase
MASQIGTEHRHRAIERARGFSPFLREAIEARPALAASFLEQGSRAAIAEALAARDGPVEVELRRMRLGLALAIALGDLSGELGLEEVTRHLSEFADHAIERALATAVEERVAGARADGIAVIALG